ncbi:hypothetical protein FACS189499_10100 [Clostridia bacterium]|nr:hypothetical protein FACS189499_10100 [Clostridia bacterium]
MKSFIKKHPYISVQIFSIVLVIVLIVFLFAGLFVFEMYTFWGYWFAFAPVAQILFPFIISMIWLNGNFLRSLKSVAILPTTWLSLILILQFNL